MGEGIGGNPPKTIPSATIRTDGLETSVARYGPARIPGPAWDRAGPAP
jgi:hypothetical protein